MSVKESYKVATKGKVNSLSLSVKKIYYNYSPTGDTGKAGGVYT